MCRELIHIYGPISIHSYGAMMFLGLAAVIVLMLRDPLCRRIMTSEQLLNAVAWGVVSGIIGARILYLAFNWDSTMSIIDAVAIWDGGLSLMGAIIGILIGLPLYLWYSKIPKLIFFDLFALYAPLLQAITRVGCFLAGCCYGAPTTAFWGICYHDLNCGAPYDQVIHPTQLYSSLIQLVIFMVLIIFRKRFYIKPGQLISLYLVLAGLERFVVDFWRGDREFFPQDLLGFISVHQLLALLVAGIAVIAFFICSQRKKSINEYI